MIIHVFIEELRTYKTLCIFYIVYIQHCSFWCLCSSTTTVCVCVCVLPPFTAEGAIKLVVALVAVIMLSFLCVSSHLLYTRTYIYFLSIVPYFFEIFLHSPQLSLACSHYVCSNLTRVLPHKLLNNVQW